jgi:putative restriction endonuclease
MDDLNIRLFAFDWLRTQLQIFGDTIPRNILQNGFSLSGQKFGLLGPQGIWKPQTMRMPISITSILGGPYPDKFDDKSGIIEYRYRGTDPNHPANRGLRDLMLNNIPLIFFHTVAENKYVPTWPVYIVADNPQLLTFSVMADDIAYLSKGDQTSIAADNLRRAYITVSSLRRVHQKGFRVQVLQAYDNQCALCRLKHPELLDAAHIIGDSEDNGEPVIPNGLSLCKIHHSAFDQNILGINPDYKIKVRRDILEEVDGPMLKHGLQSLHDSNIILPKHKALWPDKERLEIRFGHFVKAG